MTSPFRLVLALVLLIVTAPIADAQTVTRLCASGVRAGKPCASTAECGPGACVITRAVCAEGRDDGFSCPCPGSSCAPTPACAGDARSGTCAGGPRAGECCSLEFGCSDGAACVLTEKICNGGRFQGAPCLADRHCPEAACVATGLSCSGGIYADRSCVDSSDCPGSSCDDPAQATCAGDCDRNRQVTVEEIIKLVSIGLGAASTAECTGGDLNSDGAVTVEEILQAVNRGLNGCEAGS